MPRKEDIERFAQVLNSLGDEPAIRAARSESIEDVPPPAEQGQATEGDQLDALPLDAGGSPEDLGGAGTAEQESLQDIFAGLEGLPGEEAAPAEGSEELPSFEEPSTPPSAPTGDEIDFSSLFGEESAAPSIEEIEKPTAQKRGRAPQPAAEESPPPSDEEAFSFPGGEPEGLQADLSQMEVLPESLGEKTPAPGAEEQFEDLGSFPGEETSPIPESPAGGAESAPLKAGQEGGSRRPGGIQHRRTRLRGAVHRKRNARRTGCR